MVDFGNNLKKMRNEFKMTQKELADKIGVTKSVISYYELQERTPSPEVLVKLSRVFNVSVDDMLGIGDTERKSVDITGLDVNDINIVKQLVAHLKQKNDFSSSK